ncbi:MAG: cellulase family glycosylhydrolase [Bacteroidetes bacterium]|nr:cellulase family glycosylhydrolase [Bacteroidota bacterium]
MKPFLLLLLFLLIATTPAASDGFLRVSGQSIVDGTGTPVLLRGMGIGGWMVPEGYMLQTSAFANAPWEIEKKVLDLVGQANADSFWNAYRTNFMQRKDVERLAQLGFNSIRLPMHYKFYIRQSGAGYAKVEQGFIMTDSLLRWCADNRIYLILDLHAAPGGQSANNISDYDPSKPSLWQDEKNKTMTVELWRMLAGHYAGEPWIGGYDILNEPAWDLPPSNKPLRDLSIAITNAIRSVDTTHIIFVEGNWFATDFNGMAPAWDAKMVWSFHKYWNTNDLGSINYLLTLRASTNRPLWLGESGENSNTWFTDAISLLEDNNIGWAWWTWKKFGTINGPFSVPATAEYEGLLQYWKGQTSKPGVAYAMKGLMAMAEGLKLDHCVYNEGVIDAMIRQPKDATTRPFAANVIPGRIFAVNYDYGRHTIAYKDNDYHNTNNGSTWNNGWVFRNDGVDIERCTDAVTNGYNVGWTGTGEYLNFTVDVQQSGTYDVSVRAAVNAANGFLGYGFDGEAQKLTGLPVTGGWTSWGTIPLAPASLTAGKHTLKVSTFFGGFNINYLTFTYTGPLASVKDGPVPAEFMVHQNYPNPFNPSTVIRFTLPSAQHTTVEVFGVLGDRLRTLSAGMREAGEHTVTFDASGLAAGVYLCRISAGGQVRTMRMLLLQ